MHAMVFFGKIKSFNRPIIDFYFFNETQPNGLKQLKYLQQTVKEPFHIWKKILNMSSVFVLLMLPAQANLPKPANRSSLNQENVCINYSISNNSNPSITISTTFRLLVAPKIDRKNLRTITVKQGEPIYLDVNVSGEPAPDVAWFIHGNKPLQATNHRRVENVPYNTKLYNDNPDRKDTGTYKITAQNQYGSDSADFKIIVICKYTRNCHRLN